MSYAYRTQNSLVTNQVSAIEYKKHGQSTALLPSLTYTYTNGNITSIKPLNQTVVNYTYDNQNQLLQETKGSSVTGTYTYDTYGNIRSKQWRDSNGVRNYTFTYGTGSDAWLDQIKEVTFDNGSGTAVKKTLSYDRLGNPTAYYNGEAEWTYTWQYGNQLATAKKTDVSDAPTITNTYDVDGIRDSKTVGNVTHSYTTLSGRIIREAYGTTTIDYLYDNDGRPYKIILDLNGNTITGYYALNLQGDVIAIIDSNGAVAVTYEYDAWGREVAKTTAGTYGQNLYSYNRLKYRGYYFDSDLGLYYLNSRFYDQNVGRFLSADTTEVVLVSQIVLTDKNLYAYCDNNPVMRVDEQGTSWDFFWDLVSFGQSVMDVIENPTDPWAWASLGGDALDLAIPFVSGGGEAIRAAKAVNNVVDAVDDTVDTAKTAKKLHRPYIRKGVREAVETKTPRLPDGRFMDLNTNKPIDEKYDLGHVRGKEFWRERDKAMRKGWTQKQFNDYMNNPEFYQIEDPVSNRSHKYEKRR